MHKTPEHKVCELGAVSALGHARGSEVPVPGGNQQEIIKSYQSLGGVVEEFFGSF